MEQLTHRFENGEVICCKAFQKPAHHYNVPSDATMEIFFSDDNCKSDTREAKREAKNACPISYGNLGLPMESKHPLASACVVDNTVNARFQELKRSANCPWTDYVSPSKENDHNHSEESSGNMVSPMKLEWPLLDLKSNSQAVLISPPTFTKTRSRNGHTSCSCHPQIYKLNCAFTIASLHFGVKVVQHRGACDRKAGFRFISFQLQAFNTSLFKIYLSLDAQCRVSLSQSIIIRPAVDFKASPAFRLFLEHFITDCGGCWCYRFLMDDSVQYERRITRIQKQLLKLIREGRISPLDVNQYGETLLSVCH